MMRYSLLFFCFILFANVARAQTANRFDIVIDELMADPAPQQYSSTRCDPNYFDPNYFVLDSSGQSLLF